MPIRHSSQGGSLTSGRQFDLWACSTRTSQDWSLTFRSHLHIDGINITGLNEIHQGESVAREENRGKSLEVKQKWSKSRDWQGTSSEIGDQIREVGITEAKKRNYLGYLYSEVSTDSSKGLPSCLGPWVNNFYLTIPHRKKNVRVMDTNCLPNACP